MSEHHLFDRQLMRRMRARGPRRGQHFLIERVAGDLCERIGEVNRKFTSVLELSAVPGAVAGPLLESGKAASAVIGLVGRDERGLPAPAVSLDEEAFPFAAGSFDLVVSALALHGVNDLPGTLAQVNAMLKPDGLFVAALFGGETLAELRHAFAAAEAEVSGGVSPRVMPFTEIADAGHLLQRAGFALPVADLDHITVRYDNPLRLMVDLRAMGEANALAERARGPLTRGLLEGVMRAYADSFSDADGRIRATFEVITMTGWRPHESQQKPLAPGSARTRLADALGTREETAGEHARPAGKSIEKRGRN